MPILRSGTDRCVLRTGTNTLGGRGPDAIAIAALAWQPAAATIRVPEHGPAIIQRITAAVVVRLDDLPLGIAPAELRHGAHIDVGGCRLTYETQPEEETTPPAGPHASAIVGGHDPMRGHQGEAVPAHLVNQRTGEQFPLPGRRVVIGRDTDCDLVMPGKGVSRRHASISPVPGGYLLTDESSNGTFVNGARIAGTHVLDHGDVLRLHDEELRFEVDGVKVDAAPVPESRAPTTILDLTRLRSVIAEGEARSSGRALPAASLEIIRGPFAGATFHIDRPVCAIGRGEHSDVRVRDDSVSSSHATLLRKGETWYVIDLRSANGTFVDGYRIAGERELPNGATLRVGTVEMVFHSLGGVEDRSAGHGGGGLLAWFSRLFGSSARAGGR
jgi:pSer/pThr/pTyr-binding forkhead associated (FHA) protein